jgi:UDP:flavonoid glycosyltransferase YjiC (YdhE family)
MLAPAKLLKQQGHRVQFVSFESTKDRVERAGLEFHSLGPNPFTGKQLQQLISFDLDIPAKQQMDSCIALFNGA